MRSKAHYDYLAGMKALASVSVLLLPFLSSAQCPLGADCCSATMQASTIEISTTQAITGSFLCFHVVAGGNLSYDGAYSTFLVESGGTVNANGTGNVVLAKGGATVGFCGSGYGNFVYHESGIPLTCMTGNEGHVCSSVVFFGATSVEEDASPLARLRFDASSSALLAPSGSEGSLLVVTDALGRTVFSGQAGARLALAGLASGQYVARLSGPAAQHLRLALV
jgi:hypothetical protein